MAGYETCGLGSDCECGAGYYSLGYTWTLVSNDGSRVASRIAYDG